MAPNDRPTDEDIRRQMRSQERFEFWAPITLCVVGIPLLLLIAVKFVKWVWFL